MPCIRDTRLALTGALIKRRVIYVGTMSGPGCLIIPCTRSTHVLKWIILMLFLMTEPIRHTLYPRYTYHVFDAIRFPNWCFKPVKRPCRSVGYRALFVLAVHIPGSEQLCRLESVGHSAFLKANSESVVPLL